MTDKMREDLRKIRKNHRKSAKHLLQNGGFFNSHCAKGSTFWYIAQWHLRKARNG